MTRRDWLAGIGLASAPAVLRSQPAPGQIESIEHKGVLIRECTLPGETRKDDCVPAHPNGIPISRDKWLIVYATRKFRGTDDDASIVYQLRTGAPDGALIKEGMLSQSITDWDPFGDGKERFIRQHGHPVAFGVPRGALIRGKPAPNANVIAIKWRVVAKVLDREHDALVRTPHDREIGARTQGVEWIQVRLNHSENDIEIVQPRRPLRQKGFDSPDVYCSLPDSGRMNQSFVQAVPFNAECTEWIDACHFDGGKVAATKYRFNPRLGLYEWVETGLSLFDIPVMEASVLRHNQQWLIAARSAPGDTSTKPRRKAIAWVMTEDPFHSTNGTITPPSPVVAAPLCAYHCPDGVARVFTGDASVSPHHQDRDPLYCWEIDPSDNFRVLNHRTIYDTVAAGLPVRPTAAPKVDMCKLLPHTGRSQYILHRVSVRAFNHPYILDNAAVEKTIPIVNEQEKAVCAIYYAKITYKASYPSPWEFGKG